MASHQNLGVGLIGARGYTGAELIKLLERHPMLHLSYAVSRQAAGQRVRDIVQGCSDELLFEDLTPEGAAERGAQAVILALPNGESDRWVSALARARHDVIVVDLSADHRFDDWTYCIPERDRVKMTGVSRVANPGCFATGAQLGLLALRDSIGKSATVFGVSGYSGAGTTPSPRNNREILRDNLLPYQLVDHVHEAEINAHAGVSVAFMPHVAPFFRGITLTITAPLVGKASAEDLLAAASARFAGEPLVRVTADVPLVRDAAGRHDLTIGGFAVDKAGSRAVAVVTLDNLLKGAATQALQNLNLALGLPELSGIQDALAA